MPTEAQREENSFAQDLLRGLRASPKALPSHWFYDHLGSQLFEEICELPEYYPTRCERSILEKRAPEIALCCERPASLVELGSGSASKTRLIIEAFLEHQEHLVFAPIDVSQSMLEASAETLLDDYPKLEIQAFAGRYESGLEYLSRQQRPPRLTLWLGSSIGNLDRNEAARFLRRLGEGMSAADRLLIGIDLRKDRSILEAAYADSQGVTARFDLNLLARINREHSGHFDLASFTHKATWRSGPGRVESHLVSLKAQQVRIDALDLEVSFAAGETIHTESSYKYSRDEIDWLAREAGMVCQAQWLDEHDLYSLNLFTTA